MEEFSGAIWRLHVQPEAGNIAEYCLNYGVAAIGWCFHTPPVGVPSDFYDKVDKIREYQDYKECADLAGYKDTCVPTLLRIRPGDFIWMKDWERDIYYLGKVQDGGRWRFCQEARNIDAANQITNICWHKIYDDGQAPSLLRPIFKGAALQEVHLNDVNELTLQNWQERFKED